MEFRIQLHSVQDVEEFVSIATRRAFPVIVTNHQHQVNGKNFMEMFSLDVSQPLWVRPECDEAEYHLLKWDAGRFTLD
ncbi:MAG: hypothetical protein IJN20_03375 [Oscillospiraceae bacterium]|nr:hypothetical protein [Oscillospiraceae bacterium]